MVSGFEPAASHAGSQAPFHPPQLPYVVSKAPIILLPYAILILEDHTSNKA